MSNPYYLEPHARTNKRFLRLVRRRMILRVLREKAANPNGDDAFAERDDVSEEDGQNQADELRSEGSSDEADPERAIELLREAADIVRDELPTADGVEQLVLGSDEWARATAEQRFGAASSAPAAGDVVRGAPAAGLHSDGASVNPPGCAWHLMKGNVEAPSREHFKHCLASWREAGAAAKATDVRVKSLTRGAVCFQGRGGQRG